MNEDDVARRESSRDPPAFSFSYANSVFLYLRRINQINYRIQWSQQAMTVPKEGDLASLAARFENHLKLSSPETSRTRRVPAQPGQPVTADDVEYVRT